MWRRKKWCGGGVCFWCGGVEVMEWRRRRWCGRGGYVGGVIGVTVRGGGKDGFDGVEEIIIMVEDMVVIVWWKY